MCPILRHKEFLKFILTLLNLSKFLGGIVVRGNKVLEKNFQSKLIKELKEMFDGCIVTKLDSGHIQGIPDLLILYKNKWATLECKKSKGASKQPNQEYYVGVMNEMSFSRFIEPSNKQEVLHDLQQAFQS